MESSHPGASMPGECRAGATIVQHDLDAGRLRQVLPDAALRPVPLQVLHGFGRRLPARAKIFVDFVAAELAGR